MPRAPRTKRKSPDHPTLMTPLGGRGMLGPTVVMAWQLAELIERELPKIKARCEKMGGWANMDNEREGIGILASEIGDIMGGDQTAHVRRLWGIRHGERRITDSNFADALCLALDTSLDMEGIAILPSGPKGVEEMMDGYYFIKGEKPPKDDPLAKTLANFTKGFMYWDCDINFP